MPRVTDMRCEVVQYTHEGRVVAGTNLLYRVDGRRSSSRVPWVEQNPAVATQHVESVLRRAAQKRGAR